MEFPILDSEDFPYEYNNEIFEAMLNYFVPVETTELYKKIPVTDKILCSMITTGSRSESDKRYFRTWNWTSHVLLTKFGIAYKNHLNHEGFYFWNHAKPTTSGKHRKYRLHVHGETLEASTPLETLAPFLTDDSPLKNLLPQSAYRAPREYFTDFCRILYNNHRGFIKEMKVCSKKIEMISNRLEHKGFDKFIDDCRIFKLAGFSKKALKIAQDTEKLNNEDYLYTLLRFQAECYNFKSYYANAVWIYDKILELYPNDPKALELREWAQNKRKK